MDHLRNQWNEWQMVSVESWACIWLSDITKLKRLVDTLVNANDPGQE